MQIDPIKQNLPFDEETCNEIYRKLQLSLNNAYRPYNKRIPLRGAVVLARISPETELTSKIFHGAEVQNAAYMKVMNPVQAAIINALVTGYSHIEEIIVTGEVPDIYGEEWDIINEFCTEVRIHKISHEMSESTSYTAKTINGKPAAQKYFEAARQERDRVKTSINHATPINIESLCKAINTDISYDLLSKCIFEAVNVSRYSYSPYSSYPIGAALLLRSKQIFSGCNIESYSNNVTHAEKSAIAAAVAEGGIADYQGSFKDQIDLVVTYAPSQMPGTPCGGCRQVLSEFSHNALLIGICKSTELLYSEGLLTGRAYSFQYNHSRDEYVKEELLEKGLLPAPFSRKNLDL